MIRDDDDKTMIPQPGDPFMIRAPLIRGNNQGGAGGLGNNAVGQGFGDAVTVPQTMADIAVNPRFRHAEIIPERKLQHRMGRGAIRINMYLFCSQYFIYNN